MPRWVQFVLGGCLLIFGGAAVLNTSRSPEEAARAERTAAAEAQRKIDRATVIGKMQGFGLLTKHTCVGNEAQVSLPHWLELDADGKRGITQVLALYCEDQGDVARITVIDNRSGRTLATYGALGYQVH